MVERLERAGVESASLDAACLLEAASGIPRWRFVLEPQRPIAHGRADLVASMLSRREAREPIAYILGAKEFWSLSLAVSRDVLVPRPETETLVEAVLEKISSEFRVPSSEFRVPRYKEPGTRNAEPGTAQPNLEPGTRNSELVIVDLGTGCGAIALALATEIPLGRVYALDRSRAALRIASRNATALGLAGRVHFLAGDLFEPLRTARGGGGFDLIVSNPPYIPSGALALLPPEIAAYEPLEALDGGPDGLRFHRRIIEEAPGYLRAGGWLALEVGDGQLSAAGELLRKSDGFGPAEVKKDLAGHDRVVLARRRGGADG
ncbi:MAG: peptide chain release factor N(5)-glutamine methyltransferase [candidate division NC10 bacterium]